MLGSGSCDDMDLSCSESTADISPAHTSNSKQPEDWHSMEYRVLSTEEAKMELQWLLASELQANQLPFTCAPSDSQRQSVVDTLCVVAESMGLSFTTKSLAVSLLDRFCASHPSLDDRVVRLAALGCLSIAAKFEEVDFPIQLFQRELCWLWDLRRRPGDLAATELAIMSTLGFKVQVPTPAVVVDTLVCLLDLQGGGQEEDPQGSDVEDGCKRLHSVRETCKLVLARALRDCCYLRYRPSSLATAAVLVVLNHMFDARSDFPSLEGALRELYTPLHNAEVNSCMRFLEEAIADDGIPVLRDCRVEVSSEDGVVRIFQRKGPGSITTTPSSVLQSAQALATGSGV